MKSVIASQKATTSNKSATLNTTSKQTSCNEGITTIDKVIIFDRDLPNGAFRTYCVLAMFAGMNESLCVPLDNSIIRNTSLSSGAFRLYCILAAFYTECRPPIFTTAWGLGVSMGRSKASAQRYIKELTTAGIIEKVRCKVPNGEYDTGFIVHDCIRDRKVG